MISASVALLLLVPAAYLAGSIPFGLIIGLAKGVDPRKAGSGNIGATNVGRLLGGRFFAIVFLLDMLKGLLPTLAAGLILRNRLARPEMYTAGVYVQWLLVGFSAILGHMCSVFLAFKGGKGVATSAGVILGVFPYYTLAGLLALTVFVIVFKATRYVSVGSMVAAVAFVAAYLAMGLLQHWDIFGRQFPLLAFAVLVVVMIVYRHRSNLVRLRAGTEHRFTRKPSGHV